MSAISQSKDPEIIGEVWMSVVGYEGKYEVSNLGRVSSTRHGIMSQAIKPNGYAMVKFFKNGDSTAIHVSRLIARHFHGEPKVGMQVNHINGIKNDNRAENLEWVSASENIRHCIRTGLRKELFGEKHPGAKLSWAIVRDIRRRSLLGETCVSIGKHYGMHNSHVSRLVTNKRWPVAHDPNSIK